MLNTIAYNNSIFGTPISKRLCMQPEFSKNKGIQMNYFNNYLMLMKKKKMKFDGKDVLLPFLFTKLVLKLQVKTLIILIKIKLNKYLVKLYLIF